MRNKIVLRHVFGFVLMLAGFTAAKAQSGTITTFRKKLALGDQW